MTTPPVEEPPADSLKPAPAADTPEPAPTAEPAAIPEPAPTAEAAPIPEPAPAAESAAIPEPAPATEAPQPTATADPVGEAVQPAAADDELPPNPNIDELVELGRSTVTVARFADYAGAQQAVDYLSDNGFPVERTAIIGTDLRLVENVLGRLTTARAAGAGAASGAWFGLFIGLLLGIFSNSNWFAVIFVCLIIGAIWGAIFGAIAQAATGGRRDFTSRSSLQAGQYAVIVEADAAGEARALLTRLNWQASGAQ